MAHNVGETISKNYDIKGTSEQIHTTATWKDASKLVIETFGISTLNCYSIVVDNPQGKPPTYNLGALFASFYDGDVTFSYYATQNDQCCHALLVAASFT